MLSHPASFVLHTVHNQSVIAMSLQLWVIVHHISSRLVVDFRKNEIFKKFLLIQDTVSKHLGPKPYLTTKKPQSLITTPLGSPPIVRVIQDEDDVKKKGSFQAMMLRCFTGVASEGALSKCWPLKSHWLSTTVVIVVIEHSGFKPLSQGSTNSTNHVKRE